MSTGEWIEIKELSRVDTPSISTSEAAAIQAVVHEAISAFFCWPSGVSYLIGSYASTAIACFDSIHQAQPLVYPASAFDVDLQNGLFAHFTDQCCVQVRSLQDAAKQDTTSFRPSPLAAFYIKANITAIKLLPGDRIVIGTDRGVCFARFKRKSGQYESQHLKPSGSTEVISICLINQTVHVFTMEYLQFMTLDGTKLRRVVYSGFPHQVCYDARNQEFLFNLRGTRQLRWFTDVSTPYKSLLMMGDIDVGNILIHGPWLYILQYRGDSDLVFVFDRDTRTIVRKFTLSGVRIESWKVCNGHVWLMTERRPGYNQAPCGLFQLGAVSEG